MENTKKRYILNIFKGVGISIGFTLFFLLIFSLILTNTNISEQRIGPVIIVLTGISILMGSSFVSIKLNKNGILNGAIIGILYFVILYFISSLLKKEFLVNMQMFIIIAVGILLGVIGGIVGINKK